MNGALATASVLSALTAVLHGGLGESAIFRGAIKTPLPWLRTAPVFSFLAADTPEANTNLQWRYLRATWHLLTVDFIVSAVLFAVCAAASTETLTLAAQITAIRYAGYAVLWLIVVAMHHKSILRAPQWLLLLTIAACVWLGH